jgi:hypothetical protein
MWLQIAVSLVGAAVGACALETARRAVGAPAVHRLTWHLAGGTFVLMSASALAQNAFGSAAILAGTGSPLWNAYLRWAPGLNYGRNAMEVGLLGLLIAVVWRRGAARPVPRTAAWLVLAALGVAALALGSREGPLVAGRHFGSVAVMDTALFALWALALSAAVLADVIDRSLLLALGLSAAALPLNALWFFSLARLGTGVWTPRPVDMQLYRLLLEAAVLLVVVQRLRLARRGVRVAGLAESR